MGSKTSLHSKKCPKGMLLGNCINGISLALNSLFTSLVECSREVELMLSFGANKHEASSRLIREAVRTGTIPQLNSMAIIGLISIPGEFLTFRSKEHITLFRRKDTFSFDSTIYRH